MNNNELNKRLAELLGIPFSQYLAGGEIFVSDNDASLATGYDELKVLDYCTSWDELMPLVAEYGISLILYDRDIQPNKSKVDVWRAHNIHAGSVRHNVPKIACVRCLISLLDLMENTPLLPCQYTDDSYSRFSAIEDEARAIRDELADISGIQHAEMLSQPRSVISDNFIAWAKDGEREYIPVDDIIEFMTVLSE